MTDNQQEQVDDTAFIELGGIIIEKYHKTGDQRIRQLAQLVLKMTSEDETILPNLFLQHRTFCVLEDESKVPGLNLEDEPDLPNRQPQPV